MWRAYIEMLFFNNNYISLDNEKSFRAESNLYELTASLKDSFFGCSYDPYNIRLITDMEQSIKILSDLVENEEREEFSFFCDGFKLNKNLISINIPTLVRCLLPDSSYEKYKMILWASFVWAWIVDDVMDENNNVVICTEKKLEIIDEILDIALSLNTDRLYSDNIYVLFQYHIKQLESLEGFDFLSWKNQIVTWLDSVRSKVLGFNHSISIDRYIKCREGDTIVGLCLTYVQLVFDDFDIKIDDKSSDGASIIYNSAIHIGVVNDLFSFDLDRHGLWNLVNLFMSKGYSKKSACNEVVVAAQQYVVGIENVRASRENVQLKLFAEQWMVANIVWSLSNKRYSIGAVVDGLKYSMEEELLRC